MILRVTMQLTKGALGKVEAKGADGQHSLDYTGNHIAVFECALKTPPALSLIDHSQKEYILAHRLNFANWRLVDLDNYMHGNPYFSSYTTEQEWQKNFDAIIPPDRIVKTQIRSELEAAKLKPLLQEYENFLSVKEPNSNARMPLIYQAEHEAAVAKAKAKAEAEQAAKQAKKGKDKKAAE